MLSSPMGFTVEPVYDKVGWNVVDIYPLTFVNVYVPDENLLSQHGSRHVNFLSILDKGRIDY